MSEWGLAYEEIHRIGFNNASLATERFLGIIDYNVIFAPFHSKHWTSENLFYQESQYTIISGEKKQALYDNRHW